MHRIDLRKLKSKDRVSPAIYPILLTQLIYFMPDNGCPFPCKMSRCMGRGSLCMSQTPLHLSVGFVVRLWADSIAEQPIIIHT